MLQEAQTRYVFLKKMFEWPTTQCSVINHQRNDNQSHSEKSAHAGWHDTEQREKHVGEGVEK